MKNVFKEFQNKFFLAIWILIYKIEERFGLGAARRKF